jgi:hypothetical protein
VFLFRLSLFEHVFLVFTVSRRYCPCSVILRGGCNVDLKHCVFPMICGSGGSKNRLAKAVGAEPAGQMRDEKLHAVVARSTFASELFEVEMSKKCTPLWHEAHFQAKMYKTHHSRTTFGN